MPPAVATVLDGMDVEKWGPIKDIDNTILPLPSRPRLLLILFVFLLIGVCVCVCVCVAIQDVLLQCNYSPRASQFAPHSCWVGGV